MPQTSSWRRSGRWRNDTRLALLGEQRGTYQSHEHTLDSGVSIRLALLGDTPRDRPRPKSIRTTQAFFASRSRRNTWDEPRPTSSTLDTGVSRVKYDQARWTDDSDDLYEPLLSEKTSDR